MASCANMHWLLVLSLLGAACGSSDEGSDNPAATGGSGAGGPAAPTGPGEPTTLEEYCNGHAALESEWCDYLSKCCTQEDLDASLPPYCIGPEDPAECIETFGKLQTEGGIRFDGSWASSCLSEIAGTIPAAPVICDGLHLGDYLRTGHDRLSEVRMSSCRKMLAGARADGDACSYEVECQEGLRCAENPIGSEPEYTCQPHAPSGGSCVMDSDCAVGNFCTGRDFRTCQPLGGWGSPCLYVSECKDGYTCTNDGCMEVRGAGESCADASDACDFGLICDFNTSACSYPKASGMTCDYDFECEGRCDSASRQCVDVCGGSQY